MVTIITLTGVKDRLTVAVKEKREGVVFPHCLVVGKVSAEKIDARLAINIGIEGAVVLFAR